MGFKDVMALRQEGKLEEALLLARADYKEEPNQWSASALFWVLKDIATNLIAEQKNDKATPLVAEMEGLVNEMGATVNVAQETVQQLQKEVIPHYNEIEQLLTEQRKTKQFLALEEGFLKANAWHTAKKKGLHPALHDAYAEIMLLYLERKAKELSYEQFMEYIQSYLALQNQRPSNLHSRYLRLVLRAKRAYESQLHLQSFLKEWNLTLLQPSDWKRKKQEGESISLAENTLEQAVWEAYLHHQFTGEEVHLPAPYYQMLLEAEALFPHEEWLALTKCRMQVLDGQTELALELYEQLLVTTDFAQPWYEYALLCTEPTLRAAALCKALQMEENIYLDYVNHARIELAKCLVEEQLFANALRELDVYAQIKLEKGQPTAPLYTQLLAAIPKRTEPDKENKESYLRHARPAEEHIYRNIPVTTMLVTDVLALKLTVGNTTQMNPMLKLITPDGKTVLASPKMNGVAEGDNRGRLYDVKYLERKYAFTKPLLITPSTQEARQIFHTTVGCINGYSQQMRAYHLMDKNSRHHYLPGKEGEWNFGDFLSFILILEPLKPKKGGNPKASTTREYLLNPELMAPQEALLHFPLHTCIVLSVSDDQVELLTEEGNRGTAHPSLSSTPLLQGDRVSARGFTQRHKNRETGEYTFSFTPLHISSYQE